MSVQTNSEEERVAHIHAALTYLLDLERDTLALINSLQRARDPNRTGGIIAALQRARDRIGSRSQKARKNRQSQ
jgi:hypothetical protein